MRHTLDIDISTVLEKFVGSLSFCELMSEDDDERITEDTYSFAISIDFIPLAADNKAKG